IRTNSDALGANTPIVYLGDFNTYGSTDNAYTHLLAAGNGQALDPISKPGSWTNSGSFSNIHTQSPYNSATAASEGSGFSGTGGGMDDRFDFQLSTSAVQDGHGFAYIPNSYQAFGNNGTHGLNNAIDSASNTAQPANVKTALAAVLDHLPVVADYQLPAKMSATATAVPAQMIVGAVS